MDISRREAIGFGAAAAASAWLGAPGAIAGARASSIRAGRVLRVAHLTDLHVQPELAASEGLAACLDHVASMPDRPDLILTGGDLIMDSFAASEARTRTQWDLLLKTLRDHAIVPIEHCLGNHDVWGWNKTKSGTSGAEKGWGKSWAIDLLGLGGAYRSFRRAGWTFVVLDSIRPEGESYRARLDDEQFEWLSGVLGAAEGPVLIVSHAPILTGTLLINAEPDEKGDLKVAGSLMHQDVKRLRTLFAAHPQVRLCLSGHIHLLDRVEYHGVTYICDGAVSGAWWKGRHQECDEGFGVVDLYEDGRFEHHYERYAWTAKR